MAVDALKAVVAGPVKGRRVARITTLPGYVRAAQTRCRRPATLTVSFRGPRSTELHFHLELSAEDLEQAWQQATAGLNEVLALVDGAGMTDAWELNQLQIES